VKQSHIIAKNILANGASTALAGLLQLAIIIIVARTLSVAEFGAYSFMLAFAFVILRIADGGLSTILTRDLSVDPARIKEVLGATLGLAWLMSAGALLLMALVIPLFHFSRWLSLLIGVMGIEGLTQFICGCYGAVMRSQEDYEANALGFVMHKAVALVLVVAALAAHLGLAGVVGAHVVGSLSQWWFYRWKVIRDYGRARMSANFALWRTLLRDSIPLGAANVVRLLAEQADVLILGLMAGTVAVGLFSGPYKIGAGLRFLPQALVLPLIPLYSRSAVAQGDRADFRDAYERSMKSFLLMGFPFALLFIFCPATLTTGLLGHNYLAAAPATRLLGFGIWLVFLTTPFPFLLTALDRQRFMFISATISFAIRVGLDIALVHYLGFIGPCISLIVSEGFILAAWIWCVWQDGFALQLGGLLWRPLVASSLMSAVLYWFHPQSLLTLAPVAMLAGLLYLAIVLKLGGLSEVDMALLREGAEFIRPWLSQRFGQLRGRLS